MKIVHNNKELIKAWEILQKITHRTVLLDKYLENAIEVDVDGICDKYGNFIVAGIMENIEPAGIHSGDSSCVLPPVTLSKKTILTIKDYTTKITKHLKIIGLVNIQFAVCTQTEQVYILEVNPRASRTIPFVSKAHHTSYVDIATKCILGMRMPKKLQGLNHTNNKQYYCFKHAIIPFNKFPSSILQLGPEMRSTGEVMGIDKDFLKAYKKSHPSFDKLDQTKNLKIFIECSKKEIEKISSALESLQNDPSKNIKIFCLKNLTSVLKSQKIAATTISIEKLYLQLQQNHFNLIFTTEHGKHHKKIIKEASKNILTYNIPYALTINTVCFMLTALMTPPTYTTSTTKRWKNYISK